MELSDLVTFSTVARMGGITNAAEELNTVQSNVTNPVKKLEAGSVLPFRVIPHCFRLAWMAVNTEVLTESFAYR